MTIICLLLLCFFLREDALWGKYQWSFFYQLPGFWAATSPLTLEKGQAAVWAGPGNSSHCQPCSHWPKCAPSTTRRLLGVELEIRPLLGLQPCSNCWVLWLLGIWFLRHQDLPCVTLLCGPFVSVKVWFISSPPSLKKRFPSPMTLTLIWDSPDLLGAPPPPRKAFCPLHTEIFLLWALVSGGGKGWERFKSFENDCFQKNWERRFTDDKWSQEWKRQQSHVIRSGKVNKRKIERAGEILLPPFSLRTFPSFKRLKAPTLFVTDGGAILPWSQFIGGFLSSP